METTGLVPAGEKRTDVTISELTEVPMVLALVGTCVPAEDQNHQDDADTENTGDQDVQEDHEG